MRVYQFRHLGPSFGVRYVKNPHGSNQAPLKPSGVFMLPSQRGMISATPVLSILLPDRKLEKNVKRLTSLKPFLYLSARSKREAKRARLFRSPRLK